MTKTTEFTSVDPKMLTVEVNVRTDVKIDADFVGSIAQHGVLTPIVARRDETGGLRVIAGQRRTLAALKAELTSIPVRIIEGVDAEEARLIAQMIENEHRASLSESERVAAYEQLSVLGVSTAAIAKRLNTRKARVQKGLAVSADANAKAALTEHDLTLDQAAVIAEFADDETATERLVNAAARGGFDHVAQAVRDGRTEAKAIAAATAELTEQGVTVIDFSATFDSTGPCRRLFTLTTPDGNEIAPEAHAECPGHAGAVHYQGWKGETSITWVCTDWRANGHLDRHGTKSGPQSEEDKLARREVIANNKAWDSATTVRREWLRTFLTKKTAPKNTPQVIATILAADPYTVSRELSQNHRTATELFGLDQPDRYGAPAPVAALAAKATPARAQVLALGMLLAAVEASLSRQSWRHPDRNTAYYLTELAGWGYNLADIERIITDHQAQTE